MRKRRGQREVLVVSSPQEITAKAAGREIRFVIGPRDTSLDWQMIVMFGVPSVLALMGSVALLAWVGGAGIVLSVILGGAGVVGLWLVSGMVEKLRARQELNRAHVGTEVTVGFRDVRLVSDGNETVLALRTAFDHPALEKTSSLGRLVRVRAVMSEWRCRIDDDVRVIHETLALQTNDWGRCSEIFVWVNASDASVGPIARSLVSAREEFGQASNGQVFRVEMQLGLDGAEPRLAPDAIRAWRPEA